MATADDAAAAHLDGMAILHQQLVQAWQHPDDVAALDSRVYKIMQHGRYAEALSWLDEVHSLCIVMSSQHLPRQVKSRIDAPHAPICQQSRPDARSLGTAAPDQLASAHPDLRDSLLEVVALRAQLRARNATIATLQQHLHEARAEVWCGDALCTLPRKPLCRPHSWRHVPRKMRCVRHA